MNVNHKSPGPSGLAPLHLKFMCDKYEKFSTILTEIFNTLLEDPVKGVIGLESLYEFRACFIPKEAVAEEVSYRPIAIEEQILVAFHKVLKNRLMLLFPVS